MWASIASSVLGSSVVSTAMRFAQPVLLAITAVFVLAVFGWQRWQIVSLTKAKDAAIRDKEAIALELSGRIARLEREKAEALSEALSIQINMVKEVEDARQALRIAENELSKREAKLNSLLDQLSVITVSYGGLRDSLHKYATAASDANDSLASCYSRATTLADLLAEGGGLLEEGARLVAACSVAHDQRAAEVMALLRAWPKR